MKNQIKSIKYNVKKNVNLSIDFAKETSVQEMLLVSKTLWVKKYSNSTFFFRTLLIQEF